MRLAGKKWIDSGPPRRRVLATATAAVMGLMLPAAAAAQERAEGTLEKIKKSGEMVVGTSAAYAPFEYREAGKLVGFDIDLGEEIARRMGVKVRLEKKWF